MGQPIFRKIWHHLWFWHQVILAPFVSIDFKGIIRVFPIILGQNRTLGNALWSIFMPEWCTGNEVQYYCCFRCSVRQCNLLYWENLYHALHFLSKIVPPNVYSNYFLVEGRFWGCLYLCRSCCLHKFQTVSFSRFWFQLVCFQLENLFKQLA